MKKIIFILLLIAIAWNFSQEPEQITLGPGVKVSHGPKQKNVTFGDEHSFGDYTITEVAKFEIQAKVLSKKNYNSGREADLAPVDLALGVGEYV